MNFDRHLLHWDSETNRSTRLSRHEDEVVIEQETGTGLETVILPVDCLRTAYRLVNDLAEATEAVANKSIACVDESARIEEEKRQAAYMLRVVWPEINGEEPE